MVLRSPRRNMRTEDNTNSAETAQRCRFESGPLRRRRVTTVDWCPSGLRRAGATRGGHCLPTARALGSGGHDPWRGSSRSVRGTGRRVQRCRLRLRERLSQRRDHVHVPECDLRRQDGRQRSRCPRPGVVRRRARSELDARRRGARVLRQVQRHVEDRRLFTGDAQVSRARNGAVGSAELVPGGAFARRQLLYTSMRASGATYPEVWTADADGGDRRRVLRHVWLAEAAWRPG
jgi:hypothetical protein